jgi:hypothetical protein
MCQFNLPNRHSVIHPHTVDHHTPSAPPPTGPSYGLPHEPDRDKLVDVLAAGGREARSCLVDRNDVLQRHATGGGMLLPFWGGGGNGAGRQWKLWTGGVRRGGRRQGVCMCCIGFQMLLLVV